MSKGAISDFVMRRWLESNSGRVPYYTYNCEVERFIPNVRLVVRHIHNWWESQRTSILHATSLNSDLAQLVLHALHGQLYE